MRHKRDDKPNNEEGLGKNLPSGGERAAVLVALEFKDARDFGDGLGILARRVLIIGVQVTCVSASP